MTAEGERPASDARLDRSSVLRFAAEIVAWVATPWALASHSPVLAGAALLLLIGLPAVFATPGDKAQVLVAVPGYVTVGFVVVQLFAAVTAAWAAWPLPVTTCLTSLGVKECTGIPASCAASISTPRACAISRALRGWA